MPRFNLTWIYIIIAVALGILVLNSNEGIAGGSSKDVTYGQFKDYVSQGYASRIVADKEEGTVRMFVRAEHIRDVFKSGNIQKGQLPYVQTTVPSTDKLEDFLEAQSTQGNFSGDVTYNNGNGGIIRFLWSVGPLIFFIVMWLLIMRRMGGGSSSGNTQGIAMLLKGMSVSDAISKLKGINCNGKGTSCPDQSTHDREKEETAQNKGDIGYQPERRCWKNNNSCQCGICSRPEGKGRSAH